MRTTKQADLMRDHIVSLRHQIVSLKDSQMEALIKRDITLVEALGLQIELLTERLQAQVDIYDMVSQNQPVKKGWFSGQIKNKEDRLSVIMD